MLNAFVQNEEKIIVLGTTEILIVCGVVVLLFGAASIPRFARSLGRAKREFQEGLEDSTLEIEKPSKKKEVALNADNASAEKGNVKSPS